MNEETDMCMSDMALLAVFHHSGRVQRGRPVANGRRIVAQVLVWQNNWSAEVRQSLCEDDHHPAVDKIYGTLIVMCRPISNADLIVGYGVLGDNIETSAHPTYVAFALTESGSTRVDYLRTEFDELTAFSRIPSV